MQIPVNYLAVVVAAAAAYAFSWLWYAALSAVASRGAAEKTNWQIEAVPYLIAALSAAIIGAFWLFLKYGTYGIWIRATTQDRVMAQAMGIPVPWVLTAAFAIGAGMAAASGVLFGPLVGVNHAMGLDWVLKAFIVVVVGGMGNLGGSIAASIFISLLEAYASLWVSPAQAVIVSFVALILTLLFRPTGLFVPTPK